MATRALTVVYDEADAPILYLYKHWDGYEWGGYGENLKQFCKQFRLIEGISKSDEESEEKLANGMGCFAAQLVVHFKMKVGDVYIVDSNWIDWSYKYHVRRSGDKIKVKVEKDD